MDSLRQGVSPNLCTKCYLGGIISGRLDQSLMNSCSCSCGISMGDLLSSSEAVLPAALSGGLCISFVLKHIHISFTYRIQTVNVVLIYWLADNIYFQMALSTKKPKISSHNGFWIVFWFFCECMFTQKLSFCIPVGASMFVYAVYIYTHHLLGVLLVASHL